jgi:toxin FitB
MATRVKTQAADKSVASKSKAVPRKRRSAVDKPRLPIVLDSSCWIEHFADTTRRSLFADAVSDVHLLIVPILTIYEVIKKVTREAGDEVAAQALTLMLQGQVVELSLDVALQATRSGLPLADSLIYATAQSCGAELWTQDAHFEGLPGVRYFNK